MSSTILPFNRRRTLLLYLFLTAGCASDHSQQDAPVALVTPPETLQISGMKWQREDTLGAKDARLLTHFFKTNPGITGNPVIKGTPVVYHGAKQRRRFYWSSQTAAQPVWVCVKYEQRSFEIIEGAGNPYSSHQD